MCGVGPLKVNDALQVGVKNLGPIFLSVKYTFFVRDTFLRSSSVLLNYNQQTNTCSKLTIETLEKGVTYVQS